MSGDDKCMKRNNSRGCYLKWEVLTDTEWVNTVSIDSESVKDFIVNPL